MVFNVFYEFFKKNQKHLTFVPVFLLILSVILLMSNLISTGFIVKRDVELSGGKQISFELFDSDLDLIKSSLEKEFPFSKIKFAQGSITLLLVEIDFEDDENKIIDYVNNNFNVNNEYNIREIGPALGSIFWKQSQIAFLIAFIFMSILIFLLFKSFVPSGLIVFAAISDIIITLAILNIIGVDFSLPILAAILMILGYSVDTNILLTNYLLKKEGLKNAFKTGLTMYSTTIFVLISIFFISGSFVIQQISLTLIIGLLVDLPITWLTNAGLLKMWLKNE